MPIYEYQCKACGHRLEAFQKISDDPLKNCPECEKEELEKLISATSFHLKGTGWYVTDFRDKKPKDEPTETKPKEPAKDTPGDTQGKAKTTAAPKKDSPKEGKS